MKTPVLYGPDEAFPIGGSRVLRQLEDDQVTLVGAGVTVHEALRAADRLAAQGIAARVIDCYSVKPIDAETLRAAARATGGRVVVAEDHWPEGGLADAVLEVLSDPDFAHTLPAPLAVRRLAVREMPGSAKPEEQLATAGIDAEHIAEAAAEIDALWLKGNEIVAAFEVEKSTTIDSGINRFRNLFALQPSSRISAYIVVPEKRRQETVRKLTSPANVKDGLTRRIQYLTFESLNIRGPVDSVDFGALPKKATA